jgi:cupin 2 domain-containing protein
MTISTTQNIFSKIPKHLPDELFQSLLHLDNIKIERIVSKGHHCKQDHWYEQVQNEWILLLQGQAILEFENDPKQITLNSGDYLLIPSKIKHRVVWTLENKETIWLAIHIFPK